MHEINCINKFERFSSIVYLCLLINEFAKYFFKVCQLII